MQVHFVHAVLVKGLQLSLDHHVDTVVHALDCPCEVRYAVSARPQEITSALALAVIGTKLSLHFLRPTGGVDHQGTNGFRPDIGIFVEQLRTEMCGLCCGGTRCTDGGKQLCERLIICCQQRKIRVDIVVRSIGTDISTIK